jgi:hypothetical protein
MGGVKVSFDEKGEVTNEIEYQQNVQAKQTGWQTWNGHLFQRPQRIMAHYQLSIWSFLKRWQ